MNSFSFVILYVDSVEKSVDFYSGLLGVVPADASASFGIIPLANGQMLGLWAKSEIAPGANKSGGGAEYCVTVADDAAVDRLHADWVGKGVAMAHGPKKMDFGYTFLASDPDGHLIRAFAPAAS
jgi:catechol 2,3-dioxygenase-like lactoylglutathione lyase family enzyme